MDWLGRFASDADERASLLTSHYYAEGPPTDPKMNQEYLLTQHSRFDSHVSKSLEEAKPSGLPYRLSECNSCYHGGKRGVSDTFTASLWAGDFLCQLASLGVTGVNLHGGGNGAYTPIAGSLGSGFTARPVYYGMLTAKALAGATIVQTKLETTGLNLTAYGAIQNGVSMACVFNKDTRPVTVAISVQPAPAAQVANVIRLYAPGLDSTSGVTLGGSAVEHDGRWNASHTETLSNHDGSYSLTMKANSAAVLTFA